jgi:hypothetical protein
LLGQIHGNLAQADCRVGADARMLVHLCHKVI